MDQKLQKKIISLQAHLLAHPRLNLLLWGCFAAGLPFLIYLRSMAPTVYGLDSAELTTGAYALGIVHAPGSPLYLLIGHLFSRLPFGDVGYRLNLLSVCAAGGSVLFVFFILQRLTKQTVLSLAVSWMLAFSYYFWVSALAAELYGLEVFFAAVLIYLVLLWRDHQISWHLFALAGLFGLGLGNHLSLALMGPGLAWLVLSAAQTWRRPRLWLSAAIFGICGTAVYLYLPLRYLSPTPLNYARDYWHVNLASWDGFWWMVSARMFSNLMLGVPAEQILPELLRYLNQLWSNFLGLGVILGVLGLITGFRKNPGLQFGLVLMFVSHLFFYIPYRVADKELMFLPTYILWGIWMGMGAAWLTHLLEKYLPDPYSLATVFTCFLLAGSALVINFGYVDLSQDWSARQLGQKIMAAVKPDAWFFGTWVDVPVLEYLQIVEGQRSDIVTRNLFFLGEVEAQKQGYRRLLAGGAVYTTAPQWFSTMEFKLQHLSVCGCYQIELSSR